MKTFLSLFFSFTFLSISSLNAQNHVAWEVSYDKSTSEIVVRANIDPTWHLYSINISEDLGPVPTLFSFPKLKGFKTCGKMKESAPIDAFDHNFGANIPFHEKKAEFRQKVKVKKRVKQLHFTVEYMVCDSEQCLPPTQITLNLTF